MTDGRLDGRTDGLNLARRFPTRLCPIFSSYHISIKLSQIVRQSCHVSVFLYLREREGSNRAGLMRVGLEGRGGAVGTRWGRGGNALGARWTRVGAALEEAGEALDTRE